jgi:uncharacterized protein (TIGR03437 family)
MRVSMGVRRCQSIYVRAFLLALWGATACSAQGVINTVAGTGANAATGDGGPATNAAFHPDGLALDGAGNIFIADQNHNRIRKVDTSGIITTFAGNGNTQFSGDGGPASSATVYIAGNHNGLAVDKDGNLFIADDGHHRIRKVDRNGIITTVAGTGTQGFSGDGGPATRAQLFRPSGVAVDTAGNLYIADTANRRIRKVDSTGTITTLAGTGEFGNSGDGTAANQATMEAPVDVTVDVQGNVYFADQDAATVRKVNSAGIVSRVAGNGTFGFSGDGGPAVNAAFASPYSVTVDNLGNVFISDFGNRRIRKVDLNGILTTVAGSGSSAANNGDGGPPTSANISPNGVAFDSAGNYYVADFGNNRIRKVTVGARAPGLAVSASAVYFSYTAGGNVPNAQIVTAFTTGTVPLSFTMTSSTSTGGNWLNVTSPGGNTPTNITVSTNALPPVGIYTGTITLRPAAPDLPTVNIPVTLNVVATAPPRPVITGVVNGASFRPGVGANSLATIQGTNLASTTNTWSNALAGGQLPTSLDGVTVLFNGRPAYLAYISPTQINLIVPDISAGTTAVVLTNNGTSPTGLFTTPSSLYGSAFFTWPGNQIVATRQDYSYAVKSDTFAGLITAAAKPGDVLILWGTGFGPTAAPPGIPVPADKTYSTSTLPTVTINNVSATVYGAALASGYAGLYQVAIQVPDSLPDGDWPITATIGGVTSPPGTVLSVKR